MNIENLNKANELITNEFNTNFKEKYGTWEFHQLSVINGTLKLLILKLNNEKDLEKTNKLWKKVKKGEL